MKTYKARDILEWDRAAIMAIPKGRCMLQFDSSTIESTGKLLILNWMIWGTYKLYPNRPLEERHYIDRKGFTRSSIGDALTNMYRDLVIHYKPGGFNEEVVWKMYYCAFNDISNFVALNLEPWIVGTTIEDHDDIYRDPDFVKLRAEMKPNQASIDVAVKTFRDLVMNKPEWDNNQLVRNIRIKSVKFESVMQNILLKGFMSEINSHVYPDPVMDSFYEGVTELGPSMIESRSSSKSSVFQTSPLQKSQYFNRSIQIAAGSMIDLVKAIHPDVGKDLSALGNVLQQAVLDKRNTDCGSTEGVEVYLDEDRVKGLDGRFYFTPDGKSDQWINLFDKKSYTHLLGTTITLRSPMKCKYRGDGSVCASCLGLISTNIPAGSAIGHVSTIKVCGPVAQAMLSVKHDDRASSVINFQPEDCDRPFIVAGERDGDILLNERLRTYSKVVLRLPLATKDGPAGATGVIGLPKDINVGLLQTHRLSEFVSVSFDLYDRKGNLTQHPDAVVSQYSRESSLSKPMVGYINQHGFELTDKEMLVDITQWIKGDTLLEPVFIVPKRHINTLDYVNGIIEFITSKGTKHGRKLSDYTDINAALADMYTVINERMTVDSHHIEVLLTLLMKSKDREDDFGIPPFGEPEEFVPFMTLMYQRSMSALMAFERQHQRFIKEESFRPMNRPRHILDPILCVP
jgi:hypothetical protein